MSTYHPHRRYNRRGLAVPIWLCIFALIGIGVFAMCIWFDNAVRGGTDSTPDGADSSHSIRQYRRRCLDEYADPQSDPYSPGSTGGNGTVEDPQPPGHRPGNDDPGLRPGSPVSRRGVDWPGDPVTYRNR
jgi:hypothetical protein